MTASVLLATGQQDGVSLKLFGVTIPNNSLVDLDDILYRAGTDGYTEDPTNANPELHDQALLCVTDLEDCCDTPRTVRGDWYYPDGSTVKFNTEGSTFRRNRGPNEQRNGRQFYGSVRLFRKWSNPPGRGRFCCELPSAADPNINQTLFANIVNFGANYRVNPVTLHPSGPSIAGNTFSLMCSTTLVDPIPLPTNVPTPTFKWFFGPNGNASLPSGVTLAGTVLNNGYVYTSTLLFLPKLNESHAGMYTCQLGAGRLANSIVVSVNVGVVQIIPSGAPMLGQDSYTLTCRVFITDNLCPSITYQWTKNNSTAIQLGTEPNTLTFSPLRLSDAGQYTCYATISALSLSRDIIVMGSHDVIIHISAPASVMLSATSPNPVQPIGSLTCIVHVELSPAVDVPVTVNTVLTGPAGFVATSTSQPIMENTTTYTSTAMVSSLGRNQSGVYRCTATLHSMLTNTYLINSNSTADSNQITIGVYLALRNQFIANNSQVNIRNIGLYFNHSNNALQCITDKIPCCLGPTLGVWYFPNRSLIQGANSTTMFYTSRQDNGEVSLNRPSDVMSPVGQFCCELPDATDTIQTLCAIIDIVFITPLGFPIAGESYTLECSAGGAMATFEWLGSPDGRTQVVNSSSITINSDNSSATSQLQFRPLQQSHNGSYSCRAVTDEDTLSSEPVEINVNAPNIAIQITNSISGTIPTVGEDYNLICSVLGAENLNPTITYRWTKNGDMLQSIIGSNSNILSLIAPIRVSDAGTNYSCFITIASSYLTGNITAMTSHTVRIQIPTPSSIALTSSKANFNQIIGSDITLTCSVKLHSAILGSEIFLLVVDTQLTRDGTPLALNGPIVTGTTFTYTARVNSFGRSNYGSYNCTATVRPQPSLTYLIGREVLSDTLSIIAVVPPPVNVRATQSSSYAPLEVSWTPPSDGVFNITGYRIFYGSGQNISVLKVITSVGLRVDRNYNGEIVFLRSEADHKYSELVNVTVGNDGQCSSCKAMCPCSCSSEIGTAVGVMVCLAVIVITIVTVLCWWRKNSSIKKDLAVSMNVAYNDVNSKAEKMKGEYDNPANIILESSGQFVLADQCVDKGASIYESVCTGNPAAPEYTDADGPL